MKKLLSICFLSIVLVLMGFTSKAQTTNCCFWLENMQPETLQDISNLGIEPGAAALLPGHGNELVLNNTLSPVLQSGQTDVYKIHFSGCDYGKVSFEWKLYRDGQLVNDNLSAYADISIFTRYNMFNNTSSIPATCGYLAWLGGKVNGDGVCHTTEHYPNRCAGGYPGAYEEQEFAPYSDWGMGYTSLGGQYAFDYFYASFLQNTENIIVINWKQVGTYSLVIGVRERTEGTDFDFRDDQGNLMGGHQSCCGSLLASDSLHYLVTTTSQKAVCDGSTYEYGNPMAIYSVEGQYNVLFGEYTCNHWKVDSIDVLSFFTRINPDIVANNATICVNEPFTADDLAALAPAVETDAPGLVDYKIYWKQDGDDAFSTTVPTPDFRTVGTTTYYVYQENHYDAVTGDDFTCSGAIDTITFKVLPVIAPILTCNENYQYCNEGIDSNSTLTLTAELNNNVENNCADHIHWFLGTSNTGRPVFDGLNYTLNLIDVYDNNNDKEVVYSAYSFDASTETYSTTGVSVTLNFWRTPELTANETEDTIVVCPFTRDIELLSNFTSTNFEDEDLNWEFAWTKNEIAINTNMKDIAVAAPGCAMTDVYTVTAYVESEHGCISEITRTFIVSGVDTVAPVITWNTTFETEVELEGCNLDVVPAAMTLAELKDVTKITDNCNNDVTVYNHSDEVILLTTCEKQLKRTYTVTDACGNTSAPISMTYTVINNNIPAIVGDVVTLDPVRPLNNDCKSNLYTYAELLAFFSEHFTVSATCDSTRHEAPLFYLDQAKTVVADSNLDIFANTDLVTVYAQVKDECGHFSAVTPVFNLFKPEAMSIEHAFDHVTELCNTDSAQIYFDSLLIQNGLAPYSYAWSQTPASQCGIEVAEDNVHITVWPLQGGAFNTSAQFIMTATDAYGCVATDTSNAVHFYGIPSVTIVERTDNDDYPHVGEPIVVCPTFGHYQLITDDNANLPDSIDQNLTYTWSGEAIDYTSHTRTSFIAVNHNVCDREYVATVNVVNKKGCAASAQYSILAEDTIAPVITLDMPTDTIRNLSNCKIVIPDYTHLFNASTVSDNCWNMENIVVTQTPKADTIVATNTDVVITVAPKCGPAASYTIKACFPEPRIATEILATVDNACYPYETVLSTNTVNAIGNVIVKWDGSIVANTLTVNPTETAGLEHSVVVTDANGCEATAEYTLVVFHKPVADDVEITATPNNYCDNEHSNASYTVTAVNPEIVGVRVSGTNEWNSLPYTANNVPVGTYYFDLKTIHDCVSEAIDSIQVVRDTVDTIVSLDLAIVTDNANCVAPWSGTIKVVNPVDGYRYHISAGAENSGNQTITYTAASLSPLTFNFLFSDTYTVDILSTFNCHYTTDPITVADHRETPSVPEYDVTPVTNCVNHNGMITLRNTRADYDYTINNITRRGNGNVLVFGNLNPGTFTLTIASPYTKCDTTEAIVVADSSHAPVAVFTTTHNEYCVGGNGTLTVTPLDGCSYTFNDETQSGATVQFVGLTAMTSTLYVVDNNTNCRNQYEVSITDSLTYPTFAANEIKTSPRTVCTGTPDGSMLINEANGYAYIVKFNDDVVNVLSNLDAGEYTIIKRNIVTGCESDTTVTIEYVKPVVELDLSATDDIDCSEIGTAVITTTLTPNVDATFAVTSNGESFNLNGLNAGIYHVVATVIETGCEYEADVTVKENFTYPELSATSTPNYMCTSNKNGTITVVDTQTTKNYNSIIYTLNDVANPSFVGLNNGVYTIGATTDNHCVAEPIEVEVVDSAFIVRQFDVVANSMCNPTVSRPGNGSIQVIEPAASTYDYIFTYLDGDGYDVDHFDPIDYTKFDLKDGRYRIQITDNLTGCTSEDIVVVPFIPAPVTVDSISSTPDYLCTGANGSIYVHATCENASAVLEYSLDGQNFQSSNVFNNLEVGTYYITVKNVTSNCVYNAIDTIDVETAVYEINVTFNNKVNTACDPTMYNGEVRVSASYVDATLGTGNFTYAINGGSFIGLNEGVYTVTITDQNTGCTYDYETEVENDNEYTPVVNITANNRNQNPEDYHFCFGQTDGSLEASASTSLEGDVNFTYEWSSSCNHINPNGAWTNVYAEQAFCCTYTVKVTSNLTGCTKTESVKVCVDTLPVIRFIADGTSIHQTSTTPNATFENCVNREFTFGIINPGFQTINWTNSYVGTEATFVVAANSLELGQSSFCVKVVDNNGCAYGPVAANVITLPTATGEETIEGCGTVTFKGVTYTYTDAQHQYTVLDTLQAANSCDSVVTYTIVVKPLPTLTVDAAVASALVAPHCDGDIVLATGLGYTTTYVDAANAGWRIISPNAVRAIDAGTAFDPTAALTEEMNGNVVFAYAFNGCDTIFSSLYQLNVASAPTMDAQYKTLKDTVLCLGNSLTIWNTYSNRVNWHNNEGTAKLQYSVDGVSWDDFYIYHQFQPTLTDTFQVRFVASNRCGTDVVLDGPVTISAKDVVRINANTATQPICLGAPIDPIAVTVENADSVRFNGAEGLVYENGAISGTPVAAGTNNYSLTAYGACGNEVIRGSITVQDTVILNITNKNQTICLGESIDTIKINDVHALTSVEHYSLAGLLSGLYKGMTYDVSSLTNKRIYGTPTEAGTFTFTVTSVPASNTICQTSGKNDVITVTVKDTVRLQLNGNTNQVLCAGSLMTDVTYTAENATVTFENIADLDTVGNKLFGTHAGLDTVNYSVVAVSNNGCEATNKTLFGKITMKDTVTLALNPLAFQTICLGENIAPVATNYTNATVTVSNLANTGLAYANDTITGKPLAAGTLIYTVSATSNNGCTSTNKTIVDSVVVNDTLKLAANVAPQSICLGNVIADINVDVQNGSVQSVTGLPAGVTFANNKISGTPTEFGTFDYTINALSNCGCGSKSLNGTIVVKDTVKFTVADAATLTQTVCKGADITSIDFTVENATLTVQPALVAGLTLSNNSISGAPTVAGTYNYTVTATDDCGTKSMTVTIKVNDVPVVAAITDGVTKVCEGTNFVKPTDPTVTDNGATATTAWLLNGEAFDWNTVATSDLNGKTVLFVATNACGADTASVTLTVDTIPVPAVSSDVTTCLDAPVILTATSGYDEYQWFKDGTAIDGANSDTYMFSSSTEGTYHFTVQVTDGNGCVSTETVNGSTDPRTFAVEDAVTVVVTSNPGFIFTHNGEKTHYFEATTTDPNSTYTWMISNPCDYQRDKLVYVDFDIYFNGNLIDNDSIGEYIKTIDLDGNPLTEDYYVTSDSISWNTATDYEEHYVTYYNYANHELDGSYYSNHFPNGRMCGGTNNYQDLYLHFLTNREVYKTINQFKRAGEYKIVYTLMATSNRNKFEDLYHNLDEDVIDTIGGQNPFTSAILTELATDAIIINVTGENQVIDEDVIDNDEPAVAATDERSMKIYPNPAVNGSTINAEIVGISGNVVVRIVNLAGNTIAQENVVIPAGNQVYKYSTVLNNLPAGQYFIYVQGEENKARLTKKIVITK